MKKLFFMLFVGSLFILATALVEKPATAFSVKAKSGVLVQLFTSQGCSSCPPADELLGKLSRKYAGQDVFFLAYHVDYWDRLGWKDPYGQKQFTQKQYDYAHAFNLNSVYTPQAVVNGSYQFTGSNAQKMQAAIAKSSHVIASNGRLTLSFPATGRTAGDKTVKTLKVAYQADHLETGEKIYVALYIKKAVTTVSKGENRGRDLINYNTVIAEKNASGAGGQFIFDLPNDTDVNELGMLGYIQDKNKKIRGLSALKFN